MPDRTSDPRSTTADANSGRSFENGESSSPSTPTKHDDENDDGKNDALRVKLRFWINSKIKSFESDSAIFLRSVTDEDLRDAKLARILFHSCFLVPPFLYYVCGAVERPAKFPASISFTIRKGLPKLVHLLLWTAGWAVMGRILRRGAPSSLRRFAAQMYATGLWTTQLFSLGRGAASDAAHLAGAALYMVDHVALMTVLDTRPLFRKAFYGAFLSLVGSVVCTQTIERAAGMPTESDWRTTTAERARRLRRLAPSVRTCLFVSELALMISEYLLFMSFVQGIPSGIAKAIAARTKKNGREDDRESSENNKEE